MTEARGRARFGDVDLIQYNESAGGTEPPARFLPTGANLASTGVLNRGMHAEHH